MIEDGASMGAGCAITGAWRGRGVGACRRAGERIGSGIGDGASGAIGFFDGNVGGDTSRDFNVYFNGQEGTSNSLKVNVNQLNGKNYAKWA